MSSDLVERLRSRNGNATGFGLGPVCDEAADEIERLRAQVAASAPAPAPAEPVAQRPPADPMAWPLPCDVVIGHMTHKRGTSLQSLVNRARTLADMVREHAAEKLAAPAAPAGWRVERGEKWASIINTESQCGQDFYPDRDPLIFAFLCQLAAPGAPQGDA